MKFTKMQGCGNDYVYVNGFAEKIGQDEKPELVRRLSDRHFGIGGDGVIFINPAEEADFEMEMYNADGSRSEMCGNGIRCVAKYVYDKGLTDEDQISIVSAGKVKYLGLTIEGKSDTSRGTVSMVRVNMGSPILVPELVPVVPGGQSCSQQGGANVQTGASQENPAEGCSPVINEPITVCGKEYRMTCVSMGNPHAVVFMKDVAQLEIEKVGPYFENHERFPRRTNTEFVEVIDRQHVFMRVWERGTGETLACGTGCCATAVACVLNGLTDSEITVKVLGGELKIQWDREQDLVYMTGPAEIVFDGEIQA